MAEYWNIYIKITKVNRRNNTRTEYQKPRWNTESGPNLQLQEVTAFSV
jgi:hypothetical protein